MTAPEGGVPTIPTDYVEVRANRLAVGLSSRMRGIAYDANGIPIRGKTYEWSSSAPTVARIQADGAIEGLSVGETDVTLTVDGKSASARVSVAEIVAESVVTLRQEGSDPFWYVEFLTPDLAITRVEAAGPAGWSAKEPELLTVEAQSFEANRYRVSASNSLPILSGDYRLTVAMDFDGIASTWRRSLSIDASQLLPSYAITVGSISRATDGATELLVQYPSLPSGAAVLVWVADLVNQDVVGPRTPCSASPCGHRFFDAGRPGARWAVVAQFSTGDAASSQRNFSLSSASFSVP